MEEAGEAGEGGGTATSVVPAATGVVPAATLAHRHPPFGDHALQRIDPKGRIVLPASVRRAFASGGRIRRFGRLCLGVWPEADFLELDALLFERRQQALSGTHPRRALFASAASVVPDSQGRFVIPERLRSALGLGTEVMVIGNIDHLEIWDPPAWSGVDTDGEEMLALEFETYDGPTPDKLR